MLGGGGNKRETDKQVVQELPSCHHQSLAGQWAVAEIILQIILLLTVRGVWNQGQEYSKCVCVWGGGSFIAKDMPDAQRPYQCILQPVGHSAMTVSETESRGVGHSPVKLHNELLKTLNKTS